jgi:hypothetical protein
MDGHRFPGSGLRRDWAAFANMKSRHFTTDWRQVMRVRTGWRRRSRWQRLGMRFIFR